MIALDQPSERVVKALAQRNWNSATFFTASAFGGAPRAGESFAGWLSDLAGRTKNLVEEVDSADLVVMVAAAGENAQAASIIGEACSLKRVMTTGADPRRRRQVRRGAVARRCRNCGPGR